MVNLAQERRKQWEALMRESLVKAVVRVLAEAGREGLTIERVTQEAGIAKGTLYSYFQDKDELLGFVIQSALSPLEEEIDELLGSELSPERKIEEFVCRVLEYFERNREFFRVFLDPELIGPPRGTKHRQRHMALMQKLARVFEEGSRRGVFKDLPAMTLAGILFMSCVSANMRRMWLEERSPVAEEARVILEVFFQGAAKRRRGG